MGTHVVLAVHWPELRPIMSWLSLPDLEFWIVSHGDSQYSRRVRAMSRFLADWFSSAPYQHCLV